MFIYEGTSPREIQVTSNCSFPNDLKDFAVEWKLIFSSDDLYKCLSTWFGRRIMVADRGRKPRAVRISLMVTSTSSVHLRRYHGPIVCPLVKGFIHRLGCLSNSGISRWPRCCVSSVASVLPLYLKFRNVWYTHSMALICTLYPQNPHHSNCFM